MVRVTIFLSLSLDVSSVEVDQDANEYDRNRNTTSLLERKDGTEVPRTATHTIPMVITLAILVLTGFSQVLLALLLLQVAVDEDESLVVDEERPTTRLGKRSQALLALSFSEIAEILLPIGTRGPNVAWLLRRAIMSSMLTSQMNPILHTGIFSRLTSSIWRWLFFTLTENIITILKKSSRTGSYPWRARLGRQVRGIGSEKE